MVELGKAVSFMFDLLGQRDLLSLVQHLAFVQTVDRFVDVDDALKLIDEHLFGISDCLAMYLDLFPSLTAIDIPFPVTRSQKDIVAPWIGAGWNDSMASMPTRPRVFCRLTWTSSAVLRGPVALPAWWRLLRGWPFRLATFLIFIFSLVAYPYHWHRAQRSGMMPVRSQIMREVVWICGLGSWLAPLSTSGRPSAPRYVHDSFSHHSWRPQLITRARDCDCPGHTSTSLRPRAI